MDDWAPCRHPSAQMSRSSNPVSLVSCAGPGTSLDPELEQPWTVAFVFPVLHHVDEVACRVDRDALGLDDIAAFPILLVGERGTRDHPVLVPIIEEQTACLVADDMESRPGAGKSEAGEIDLFRLQVIVGKSVALPKQAMVQDLIEIGRELDQHAGIAFHEHENRAGRSIESDAFQPLVAVVAGKFVRDRVETGHHRDRHFVFDFAGGDPDPDHRIGRFLYREEQFSARIERNPLHLVMADFKRILFDHPAVETELQDPFGIIAHGPERLPVRCQRQSGRFLEPVLPVLDDMAFDELQFHPVFTRFGRRRNGNHKRYQGDRDRKNKNLQSVLPKFRHRVPSLYSTVSLRPNFIGASPVTLKPNSVDTALSSDLRRRQYRPKADARSNTSEISE